MATNKSQTIQTLGECLLAMATYAGGSVPASTETEYDQWVRWIQLGQEDGAKRGFWSRLLVSTTLAITANVQTAVLPDNFHKRNGIYILSVGDTDWASPNNDAGQMLHVYKDATTGAWTVYFKEMPTESATATLWYFFNPPTPENENDVLFLDGEMIMFYALKEYYRKAQQPGSLDDARIEYENRFSEGLANDMLPSRQELIQFMPYHTYLGQSGNEKDKYWPGRSGRNRG